MIIFSILDFFLLCYSSEASMVIGSGLITLRLSCLGVSLDGYCDSLVILSLLR